MEVPYLSSFGARRTKHGFERRVTWLMVSLAVLLAVLAVAVPVHRTAWANEPVVTISVTDINYETATASFTVTGLPDSVSPANWIASVNYKAPPDRYGHTLRAGPGKYSETQDDFTAVLSGNTLTADIVHLTRLIPDSEHTLTVTIMQRVGRQSPERAKDSTTFTAKSGCSPSPEPNHKDPDSISPTRASWFGIYEFRHVTETEFLLEVSLNSSFEGKHAPVNSGACVYYKYDESFGTFQSGIITAYIHDNLSGGKRGAFIRHTGLTPATRYGFRLTMDKESDVGDITVYGTTLGPNTGIDEITFTDITQNRARATATIENASRDPKFGYWHYRESSIDSEPEGWGSRSEKLTEGATFPIELDNLDAGTRYELEASVKDNFNPNMSMTKAFVTLPGKPGISPLEVGNGSLKVTWTAPAETPAPLTGYRVQWQDYVEYFDYNTDPPPTSTLDYDDVAADVTNRTIENLTNGTKYVVIVIAKNESFDDFGGTASDYESGTPMSIPNAPNSLLVGAGNEKLTLTWKEPTEKVGVTITDYVVEYKENAAQNWTSSNAAIQTITDTQTYRTIIPDLTNDTLYDVRVRADNGVTSDNYEWATGSGTPVPDPSIDTVTVDLNSVTQTEATVTVTIDDSNDEEQTILLQYRTLPDGEWSTPAKTDTTTTVSKNFRLEELTGNTEYEVQAWLQTDATTKVKSLPFTTSPVVPDPPTITDIEYGDRQLTVTWNRPGDGGSQITGYKIEWTVKDQNNWTSKTVDDPNALDGSTDQVLTNGTEYTVQVIAVNAVGDSQPSNQMHDIPSTVPSAPTITDIIGGNERLVVEWDEPDDGGSTITEYTVQWMSGIQTFADAATDNRQATVTTLTHTIQGLANDTLYTVQVRARNENEYGPWSAEDTGTPVPNPSIGVISVKTKSQTDATLTVTIERSDIDNEQTVHLRHHVKSPPGAWQNATPQDTGAGSVDFDISDLTGNTVYEVEAWLAADTNDIAEYELTTNPVVPDAPDITSVAHGDGELTVTWTAPTETGGAALERFVIQWKPNTEPDWTSQNVEEGITTGETILTYEIASLSNGTTYDIRVRADNGVVPEAGQDYNWDEHFGTPDVLPDKPTIQSVVEGHTQLEVTWDEPANTGSDITGYVVQWKDNSVSGWESPLGSATLEETDFTHTITSLANRTEYAVRVRAVNGLVLPVEDEDDYNWSDEETGTPRPEPIVTRVTVADATITRTEATATVAIENETDDGQTVHLHYRKTTESGWTPVSPKSITATATSETFGLSNLTGNTDYVVEAWLATTDNIKESATFKTGPVEPNSPRNVDITGSGDEELTVAWDAPLGNGGSAITGYKVQWKEADTPNWDSPFEAPDDASPYKIENLTNGTAYDVRVLAVNDVGDGPPSGDVEGTPSKKPDPPTDVEVSAHGNKWLEVTWTELTEEEKGGLPTTYIVQWKSGSNYSETDKADPATSPYEITNLENGTLYTVRVLAKNDRGTSDDPGDGTNEDTGTPMTKPQKPTDVTITGSGDKSLTVSWTAPTGVEGTGGSPITGFKIQWKLNSDADWNTSTYTEVDDENGQSPYTINQGLSNGIKYDVRVLAVNRNTNTNDNTSDASNSATGTPSRKPDAPTGVDITDYGDGWLEVTWNAVTGTDTGGSDIKNYIVQWKSGANYDTTNQATPPPTKTTYKITNLENGTLYTVRLLAVNKAYPKDPSDDPGDGTNEDTETPRTKPKPPTGVNISDYGDGYLEVAWTAPEDKGGSALVSFKVQWKESSVSGWDSPDEKTVTAVSGKTDYETTISSLANGTKYTVQVLAVNGNRASDNTSDSSNTASGTPSTTPNAPKSVTITNKGDQTLTVTWEPPDEIGGLAITNYKVQWMDEDDTDWTSPANDKGATDRSHVITDLTNGIMYTVQVFAKNENGYSNEPGEVTGVPSKRPDPPTDVEVTAHGDGWLEVTWTEPEDKGGLPTTYIVQWKSGSNYSETDKADPATSPYEITNLENGTLYTVRVLAKNDRGTSDDPGDGTNEDTGTPMTKPQKPTDVTITGSGDKSLTVSWTAPTGVEGTGGSPITGFKIQWKLNSDADWNTSTYTEVDDENGQSPYTINQGLSNGIKYDVRVLAVNRNTNTNDNTSDASNSATGTPSRKPDAPTGVDITDYGDGWLEVTWNAVTGTDTGGSDIKNYIVQWKSGANYDTTNQATPPPTKTTYKITNLENGTLYTVRLLAVNKAYPKDPSDDPGDGTNEDTETPRTIPEKPTDLGVISGDKELTVSWTAPVPEKNGGARVNQYIVQWKSGDQDYGTSRQETPTNTSQVITPLTNGMPYSIRVRADNGEKPEVGQDYNWEETTGTPMTVPGAPTNLEVEEGDRQLKVSWVAPTETGGLDIVIDHFVIQWRVKGGNWISPDEHTTTDGNKLTDTITGLLNGTDYDIRVRADNDVEGQTFEWAYTTGMPKTIPSAPRSLRVTPGDGQLALSWAVPSDDGGLTINNGGLTINRYVVQWKSDSDSQQYNNIVRQGTTSSLSYTIRRLTNGDLHSVRVRADNTVTLPDEESYNWAPETGTPVATPSPPPPPQNNNPPPPPPPNNPPPQRSPVNPTPPVTESPEVASVSVTNETQTTADATVKIDNAGTAQNTVNLRYSVDGEDSWTYHTKNETGSTVEFPLSSLTAGTAYEVEAWLGSDTDNKVTATFMTIQAAAVTPPSISSIDVGGITKTSATATVNIANPGDTQNTVNLRYSVDGEDSWTDHTKNEAGSTVEFPLSSLTAGTAYEVEAWLGSDTDNKVTATFTTSMAPSISSIGVGGITKTSATATVNIANPGDAQNTVNLRYSVDGEDSWTYHTKNEAGSTVEFPLSSLTAGTTYEVEAWLGSDTDNKVTATFITTQAVAVTLPSISSISITNEKQTTADAIVEIDNADTAQNTVNLRYSVDGEDSWTDHTKNEAGSTVEFPLSSLTAGTTYEVEAWLGSDTDNKVTATFMTIQAAAVTPPSISSVRVLNIAQTNARVVVGLANANTGQKVYMQYKLSSAQWPTTLPQPTTQMNGSATFILSSLTAGTGYHTRVSLNSDMSDATTRSFTTSSPPPPQNPPPPRSPVVPPPSVSLVTFNNETQTSADATVNIADAGTAKKTVRLHHRIEGTTGWSTPPKVMKTPGSSTTILLTGLTAGTTYEVQAWLNSNAPPTGTTVYTFNTLPNDPDISNLKMKNIRQTSATAMVEIADAGTGMKEVYLKHSIDGTDEWSQLPFPTITYADSTSIELTGLEEQTTYQVMVDLTDGFDKPKSSTFTTLAAPSLSGVSISSITRTGAVATATIADAGTAQKTMHLRYREFGETEWSTAQAKTTTGASAAFNLTGLDPRTTYEVQASLGIEFGTSKYAVFTTLSPDPSVSGVSVGSITQTSAATTVAIAYPGIARKTVRLRYRVSGETEWGAVQMKATSGGSAAIDLTGLSPRTMYEVEASLSSDFANSKTATFSTLSLDPSVSEVSIGSITQTSAVAAVTIANPGTAQKIVYLQYRVDGASEWSDSALTATTDGPSATIYMTGIIADTEYEVRASLASDFALAQHATFTTLRYPSIYDVDVTDVTKNTATAEIDIADPDGTDQTVHLRYRTTAPQGTWSSTLTTTSTTGEASIDLTGLTVDTEYEVEASLAADFAIAVSDTFRTLPPDPVVAEVSVNSIRQTTATAYIDISNANGSTQKVSLRYRTTTPRGNWSDIQTTTSTTDSASIDLSELTPGTEYDVQASLDNSFLATRTKLATFATLRWPSIASFEAENIGRNGATVSATIADSRGVAQTVYVRHRATGYIAWRSTQQMDSVDDIASLRLRGLSSGTEYTAEASLDNSFPDGGTRSVTFTTKERDDEDAVDSDIAISTTRTTNVPLLGFTPQMLRFVAIEGGDNPAPQAFSVWNRAHGSMSFNLSNHEEWLSQQPMSGVSNGSDDPVTITASVDSSELASGQYVDVINIDVTSSGKSPGQVIVILDVLPPDYIRQFVSRDEGGIVVLPDGTVKIVVEPESPPKDVDIELMKVNLQAHGQPPGEQERVVVAIESNTYEPGGDTPEDVAYAPYVELWVQLPEEDAAACDEGKTRVYSVETGTWSLIEHRCETDESDKVWAVAEVERLGAFALVIDDAPVPPTPTPVAAAVAATATAIPASAPAVAVQRISLPAQPPTPTPISVPTPVPMPNGKTTVAPAMAPTPTPTAVPAGNEPSAPMMQASAGDGGSGGFGRIILAALGVPMLIGTLIVVYLLYRERRRRDDARMI